MFSNHFGKLKELWRLATCKHDRVCYINGTDANGQKNVYQFCRRCGRITRIVMGREQVIAYQGAPDWDDDFDYWPKR